MVKKLVIFPANYPPHKGGLETHVQGFAETISKKDFKVLIFTPRVKGSLESENKGGLKILRYPSFEVIGNFFVPNLFSLRFWKQYKKMKKFNSSVVMTRTSFFVNSTIGFLYSVFNKKKLIHVEHGSDFSKLDSWFKSVLSKLYVKLISVPHMKKADMLVGVSNASKNFITKLSKRKDVFVIRRGINYSKIEGIKPHKFNNKTILFVGRLIDGKGVQDLIKSKKYWKKDYDLFIIGEGPYMKTLKSLSSDKNIKFLGAKSFEEVISYMKGSFCVVNPSHTEGLPTTVIEGVLSQTSVIATDVGGTFEVLEDFWDKKSYFLIKPKKVKDLASAINKLQVFKSNEKAINFVKKRFSWEEHTKRYEELIKDLEKK